MGASGTRPWETEELADEWTEINFGENAKNEHPKKNGNDQDQEEDSMSSSSHHPGANNELDLLSGSSHNNIFFGSLSSQPVHEGGRGGEDEDHNPHLSQGHQADVHNESKRSNNSNGSSGSRKTFSNGEEDKTATFYIKIDADEISGSHLIGGDGTVSEWEERLSPQIFNENNNSHNVNSHLASSSTSQNRGFPWKGSSSCFQESNNDLSKNQNSPGSKANISDFTRPTSHSTSHYHHMQPWKNSRLKDIFSPLTLEKIFIPPGISVPGTANITPAKKSVSQLSSAAKQKFGLEEGDVTSITENLVDLTGVGRSASKLTPDSKGADAGKSYPATANKLASLDSSISSSSHRRFIPRRNINAPLSSSFMLKNQPSLHAIRQPKNVKNPKPPLPQSTNGNLNKSSLNEIYNTETASRLSALLVELDSHNQDFTKDEELSLGDSCESNQSGSLPVSSSSSHMASVDERMRSHISSGSWSDSEKSHNVEVREPRPQSPPEHPTPLSQLILTNPTINGVAPQNLDRYCDEIPMNPIDTIGNQMPNIADKKPEKYRAIPDFSTGASSTMPFHVKEPSCDYPTDIDDLESVPQSTDRSRHIDVAALRKTLVSRQKSTAASSSSGYPTDIDFLEDVPNNQEGPKYPLTLSALKRNKSKFGLLDASIHDSSDEEAEKENQGAAATKTDIARMLDETMALYQPDQLITFKSNENELQKPVIQGYLTSSYGSTVSESMPPASIGISPMNTQTVGKKNQKSTNNQRRETRKKSNLPAERRVFSESLWNVSANRENNLTLKDLERNMAPIPSKPFESITVSSVKVNEEKRSEFRANLILMEPNDSVWFILNCLDLSHCGPTLTGTHGLNELCPQLSHLIL